MTRRPAKAEWIVVGACLVIGTILRCWHLDRESVEHFDEGVYASVLWYDGVYGHSIRLASSSLRRVCHG